MASKIRKKDWRSGAVGAVVAEATGDIYRSNLESNGQFDPNSSTFGRELAVGEELAKFFATTTACLLDLDPAEAARSGAIAVRENSFEKKIGVIVGIPVAVLSMTVAETFLDPAIKTVNDKVAAIEKSISQYAKDSNLTPAEQRTLAQTLVHHLDAVLKEIPGPALSISRLAKESKNLIEFVLKGVLETRDYGRELSQDLSKRIGQGNRVQNFLSQMGGVSGMTIGLGLSVMGKGKGGKPKADGTGQKQVPSIKSKIKKEQLPTQGKIRFVPRKDQTPTEPLRKGPNDGFYDKFDNEWTTGSSRTRGEQFEWDVILSPQGRKQLGWATRDGSHLNVSLKGRITHK